VGFDLAAALEQATLSGEPMAWLVAHATRFPLLGAAEERELALRMRNGTPLEAQAARERLIMCNLRLVMRMAARFQRVAHVDLADLTQEGVIGLMRAVEKFEPGMDYKLCTYATWWISQGMHRAAASQGHAIRVPQHVFDLRRRALQTRAALLAELGVEPTLAQWSAETGIEEATLRSLLTTTYTVLSLDTQIHPQHGSLAYSDDSGATFSELLVDPEAERAIEEVAQAEESGEWIVEIARGALRDERRSAMKLEIFLAHGRDGVTLEALGRRYRLTREAVRQHYWRTCALIQAAMGEALKGRTECAGADRAANTVVAGRRRCLPRKAAVKAEAV
jgi:RNA polymerase sigma factor (sigma-70 family)